MYSFLKLTDTRSIVFTFWKRTLDILAHMLDTANIQYLRLDGSLTAKNRNEVLTKFQSDAASKVLIMTFSTGAVGYGARSPPIDLVLSF